MAGKAFEMSASPLESALQYVRWGWPVFPCHTAENGLCSCDNPICHGKGKHPRTQHGFKDSTIDETRISRYWHRMPDANIGIATGEASGIVVLDVDGDAGEESIADLQVKYGAIPETIEAITGSGGRHIYFAKPFVSIRNSESKIGPGLDIRGDGGYVIAPPSMHVCGAHYEWELSAHPDDIGLAEVPPWLLQLLGEAATASAPSAGLMTGAYLPLGKAALEFIALGAPEGSQRSRAVAATRNLLSNGRSIDEVSALVWRGLEASGNTPGRDPWTFGHAVAIVEDLARRPAPAAKALKWRGVSRAPMKAVS
jgi:hypothetical protein